jgi:nicotinate-nucleotide pyrophosphorylase (carboxylating)
VETYHTHGLSVDQFIDFALAEDIGDGDHTTQAIIGSEVYGVGVIRAKEGGIICGLTLAERIFSRVDTSLKVHLHTRDGAGVTPGETVLRVEGKVASILTAERLVLNCMQRMSGIATMTRRMADLLEGTTARLLDTRKTTPNFRVFEKQAVAAGGGMNHRFGLYDMILIKDNHVDAAGGIVPALQAARKYLQTTGKSLKIEVETRTLDEVREAVESGLADRLLLDNFSVERLREAVAWINGRVETEASGNINEQTIRAVAETGVSYISCGALTHSYKSLDLSLTLQPG